MPCTTPHLPTHTSPVAPCPAALSCLCSHHNKPGADGALLCLAGSDGQALAANSLLGNQLTGLDSARCFYHFSSPSVGGAGRQAGRQAGRRRRQRHSGGISGRQSGRWLVADSRLEISADSTMRLPEAPWDWADTRTTNRCKQPPAEPPRTGYPPSSFGTITLISFILAYWRVYLDKGAARLGTSDCNTNKVRTPQKKGEKKPLVCAGSFLLKPHLWSEGGKIILFEVLWCRSHQSDALVEDHCSDSECFHSSHMCLQGAMQRVRMYLRCRHTQGHDHFFPSIYLLVFLLVFFFFFFNKGWSSSLWGPGISLESTRETPHLAARLTQCLSPL